MAGPGALAPIELLQISHDDLASIIREVGLRKYGGAPGEFSNCVNIGFVYLGLIQNTKKYMELCTGRARMTTWAEMGDTIESALRQGGIRIHPIKFPDTIIRLNIDAANTFRQRMLELGSLLRPQFATPVGFEFPNGSGHMIILRKNEEGHIFYVDPQLKDADGSYPLKRRLDIDDPRPIPGEPHANTVVYIKGPTVVIPPGQEVKFAYNMGSRLMNERSGGKRSRKGRKQRRSGKSLKSVRKV